MIQHPNQYDILIVDHTPDSLDHLSRILQERGFRVRPTTSGRHALKSVAVRLPDLILLDVKMPNLDGYEVCRRLKSNEHSCHVPVIFINAFGETAKKAEGYRAGGVDYIAKPFEPEDVLVQVENQLRQQTAERRRIEAALSWEMQADRATAELSQALLSPVSIDDFSHLTLEHAKRLTGSAYGYVGYIDPETGYLVCPTLTRDISDSCRIPDKEIVFKEFNGLWGWVLQNRRSLLTNTPVDDSRSSGTPPGHMPIHRFLSAPALIDGTLVGQVSVANANRDYTDRQLKMIERLAGFYAIAFQRQQAEEERLKVQRHLRTIVENFPDFLARFDEQCRHLYINPAVEKGLGVTLADYVGKTLHDLDTPGPSGQNEMLFAAIQQAFKEGAANIVEAVWPTPEGERTFEVRHIPELNDDGKVVSVIGVTRDITEQRRAEKEIRQLNQELEQRVVDRTVQLEMANKELEAFADSVSHDLRAPLRHIGGFVELLRKNAGTALDDRSRNYMDTIAESANKMGLLIDNLLAFSRMGRHAVSFQAVALGDLVREVITELSPDAAGREISWRIGDLPAVRGDAALLRLVLVNLIDNALKFTQPREKARIEIGWLSGQDAETVIFVRDNGVGFDMTYADKLFGVFQRLHRADEFQGTGIGLANVRRIVARHGGRTWAEGNVDQGATFYFSLLQKQPGIEKSK